MKTPALSLLVLAVLGAAACGQPADGVEPELVRRAVLAGTWYPGEPDALRADVTRRLAAAAEVVKAPQGRVRALVAPHAGYRYSGDTAALAYATIRNGGYRRVVVIAPSHRVAFDGVAVPPVTHFTTPLGWITLDVAARDRLAETPGFVARLDAHAREHSLEIHLPFLQVALGEFTLVPLVVGRLTPEAAARAADAIRPLLDETTLLVASSDFTHHGPRFGYRPFREDVEKNLRKLDLSLVDRILAKDRDGFWKIIRETKATVCGRQPIGLLMRLLPEGAAGRNLGYTTSGALTGDWTNTVSYVSIAFATPLESPGLSDAERKTLLRLARRTLEMRFAEKDRPTLGDAEWTPRLREKRGVFVTLHIGKRLRGCIGYITGRKPLAEAVIDNALNAAFRDPRFPALTGAELSRVHIEISVMTPLRTISDPLREVEVGRHGITLEKVVNGRMHRGVFLPQVPVEQGWDLAAYLKNICYKARLRDPEAWKDATIKTFEAQVFGEPEGDR
jgi:AmmeMemoRadiSam system protein B/AmmeMemoRadiSam system protein A